MPAMAVRIPRNTIPIAIPIVMTLPLLKSKTTLFGCLTPSNNRIGTVTTPRKITPTPRPKIALFIEKKICGIIVKNVDSVANAEASALL